MSATLAQLNQEIIGCTRCPRLVDYCQKIGREKRRAYRDFEYWAKPVPGFGDPKAGVLILGLAPGAHGSNRTGRPFTGDASGNFLYRVLYKTGFASQPSSIHKGDGLELRGAYITAAVHCAPPANKPTPQEIVACSRHLHREFAAMDEAKIVLVLGRIALDAYLNFLKQQGLLTSKTGYVFAHGAEYQLPNGKTLLCSFHPSLQNTNTGKLTEKMMIEVFRRARKLMKRN